MPRNFLRLTIATAATLSVCLISVSACSSDSGYVPGTASGAEGIRDTVTTLLTAVADGDGKSACSMLTGKAKRELIADMLAYNKTCEEIFATQTSLLDAEERKALRSTVVREVTITGSTATVEDSDLQATEGRPGEDEDSDPLYLIRSNGQWLVDDLG